ncbi:hypothetical protein [Parasitella parasitica]|uniref:Choice-of-anchor A domain-containing protein n=1 Tax=Parasitella parasitica TaxID=35722 RepID=A0A0B7NMY3_9FUNG|nr:hypothetical protein [Parasitella parasitica]
MKYWVTTAIVCLVLSHVNVNAAEVSKLRSPQCVADLMRNQVNMMQHFNGIFGDFSIKGSTTASMYGPIAALNITSSGYSYNSRSKMDCGSKNYVMRLGLMSKNAQVQGDINGDIWTENGSIDTKGTDNCAFDALSRIQHPSQDLLQSLFSFAPTTIRETSAKLSRLAPDTAIASVSNGLVSVSNARSFNGYRVLKLPACSDRACAVASRLETNPNVLKGANTWTGQYKNGVLPDEMIVFNIPVYVGGTFTISTLDVNKGISPCQAIFNFYAVNQAGNPVSDPNASFTLVRSAGVVIAGTILAPQARIIDASTGSFGGQLITLQSYEGHGADIKDFDYASKGQCTSRSLCWPIVKPPRVVTAVVTATALETVISTVKTENAVSMTIVENRAAVPAPSVVVTETVTLNLPSANSAQVFKPVAFYAHNRKDEDIRDERRDMETVTDRKVKIMHETVTHTFTRTHLKNYDVTKTMTIEAVQEDFLVTFSTELFTTTVTPTKTLSSPPETAQDAPFPSEIIDVFGINYSSDAFTTEDCASENGNDKNENDNDEDENDDEDYEYEDHEDYGNDSKGKDDQVKKKEHHHHEGKKHWNKSKPIKGYYEEVDCYWRDILETTICMTHTNEEFSSATYE